MSGERGPQPRRWKTPLAVAAGVLAGALGTAVLLTVNRATAVAFLSPSADARVVSARGRTSPAARGAALVAGDRVQSGATLAAITTETGVHIDLGPRGQLTMLERGVVARLEQGGMVVDAVAAVEQVRVATAAGEVMVTGARVELSVSAPGGRTGLVALVHVEQGSVRLEAAGREVALAAGERGVLASGRPPSNVSFIIPATRAARTVTVDEALNQTPVPVPVAVPIAVPVAVPVASADYVPGGDVEGTVELVFPAPSAPAGTGACTSGDPPWAGDRGRLKNVHVRVSSPLTFRRGAGAIAVARKGCAFLPRVAAATIGQSLELTTDGTPGVQVFSGPDLVFSGTMAPVARWPVEREGLFRIQTGGRSGPTGYVAVSSHPFAAITGADGKFRLSNVPPGHHTLTAWHELGGERTAEVLVIAGRTAEAHFAYEGERPLLAAVAPAAVEPRPAGPSEPVVASVVAAAPAAPAPEPPPSDGRCHIATDRSVLARACQGGIGQAKTSMKNLVLLARRRGARVDCGSCHADDSTFDLLPVARERLDQLLAFVTAVPVESRGATASRHRRER